MIKLAEEKDKNIWQSFVEQTNGSFLQSWQWGELQKELAIPFWRILIKQDNECHAAALVIKHPLPFNKSWLYIPKGPVLKNISAENWVEIEKAVKDVAEKEHAFFIRIDPEWDSVPSFLTKWRVSQRHVQPQHTLVIDLKKTEEELLATMHPKTRYNIRLAQKKGVTIRFSKDPADIKHFLKLTTDVEERSAFRFHPAAYYTALAHILLPAGLMELAMAEYNNTVLAVHLIVTFNKVTTYAHGASSSEARSVMAPHLLQWETMKRFKEQGSLLYDFYGIAISPQKNHPWSGISRFKKGFGGKEKRYIGAYDWVIDKKWYWAYNMMHRVRR